MINFANPQYLYALIAVPLIAVLYVLARINRRRKLARFGTPAHIAHLMPEASRYLPGIKIIIALLALTFIILGAARPYVHTDSEVARTDGEETVSGIEVMLCVDVSNSMLASSTKDLNGVSRLQRTKFILDKMLATMVNDRVGLIVFAGNAYLQLPLTPDIYSAKMIVNSLSTEMVPMQGTDIRAAIEMAVNSFDPNSDFNKAIVIVTDGETFESDAVEAAKKAQVAGIQVDVIGIGDSDTGMPIPLSAHLREHSDLQTTPDGYLTYDGEEVRTKLDAHTAAQIAEAGGGIYLNGSSPTVNKDIDLQLDKIKATEYKRSAIPTDSTDLFALFASLALILLLIDILLPYRKIQWLRNIKFFSKK